MTSKLSFLLLAVALIMPACASSDYSYANRVPQAYYRPSQNQVVFQGPQYYRVQGIPYGTQIRNYTDAPIVVTRPGRSREIIPRTW